MTRRRGRSAALAAGGALALGLGLGAGCATVGGISGRVEPTTAGRGFEYGVVYLVGPGTDRNLGGGTVVVSATAKGLDPGVRVLSVDTKVEFRNRDRVFHKIFSVSPAPPFDVGSLAPGQSRTLTFEHPGVINVYCELHPSESAYLIVVPTRYFARVGPDGHFQFPYVKAGAYTLTAWHPDLGTIEREITVPAGATLQVDLAY